MTLRQLSDELSKKVNGMSEDHLERLMRVAINGGVFEEVNHTGSCLYRNNSLSSTLVKSSPGNLSGIAHLTAEIYSLFDDGLAYAATKGPNEPSAFERTNGVPFYQFLESNANERHIFADAMTGIHSWSFAGVCADMDFSAYTRIIDIGGSFGSGLKYIMQHNPHVHGVLFDSSSVIEQAKAIWSEENADLAPKVNFVNGSMLDADTIPPSESDSDLFMIRNVLHNWKDDQVIDILRNLRNAAGEYSPTLIIIEVNRISSARKENWMLIKQTLLIYIPLCV